MTTTSPAFEHLFDKTKTICFGRFLIDVPHTAEVVYGPTESPLSIERHPGQASHMDELIAVRLAEIEKDRYRAYGHLRGKDSMLGQVISGAIAKQKIVFGVSPGGGDFYLVDSYLPLGDDLFVQEADPYGSPEETAKVVKILNSIAPLLRARPEHEIPAVAGLCTDGGFISDKKGLANENFRLGIRLAEFPDVHISVATSKKDYLVESDAIEGRLEQAEKDAKRSGNGVWYSRIKILRRGNAVIEKWTGFEILARKPPQADVKESHEFAFLSHGEPKNPYSPVLDVKLHTGVKDNQMGGVKPSINDEEALLLWDKLTRTIRVRPVDANFVEQNIGRKYDVGALALSGRACPESGWWECADGGNDLHVSGGALQYFRKGMLMPQAVLLRSDSLWLKLKGHHQQYATERPTVWTLAKTDELGRSSSTVLEKP